MEYLLDTNGRELKSLCNNKFLNFIGIGQIFILSTLRRVSMYILIPRPPNQNSAQT